MIDTNKSALLELPEEEEEPEPPLVASAPEPQPTTSPDVPKGPPLCQVPEPKPGKEVWEPCGLNSIADLRIDLFECPLLAPMHVCAAHLLKIKMGSAVNIMIAPVPGIVIASEFDMQMANGNGSGKILLS